jgi:hypothetical protein
MGKTNIKFRMKGFEEIRRSPKAVSLLQSAVNSAASAAGDGYVGSVVQGEGRGTLGRAIGTVFTDTPEAMRDNAKHNTLMDVFDRLGG